MDVTFVPASVDDAFLRRFEDSFLGGIEPVLEGLGLSRDELVETMRETGDILAVVVDGQEAGSVWLGCASGRSTCTPCSSTRSGAAAASVGRCSTCSTSSSRVSRTSSSSASRRGTSRPSASTRGRASARSRPSRSSASASSGVRFQ